MAIAFEKDDILIIARYLSEQGFYYSPQWEQAADEIERLREALRVLADLDNWDDIGHWAASWDSGTPWEFARAALEEKE